MSNADTITFWWGFGGSIAIEAVTLVQFFHHEPIVFPKRYKLFWYYILRIFIACIGGGLAVAYGIDKPLLAINIGASAPLILQALSKPPKELP